MFRIFFTTNHIVFEFEETIVVSRLIEGEYFRIDQMLSSDYETKVTVNKRELLELYRPCDAPGERRRQKTHHHYISRMVPWNLKINSQLRFHERGYRSLKSRKGYY